MRNVHKNLALRCRISTVRVPACFVCKIWDQTLVGRRIYRWNYGTGVVKANKKGDIWLKPHTHTHFLHESQTDMSGGTQVWRRCGGRLDRNGDSHTLAEVPSGNQPVGAKMYTKTLCLRLITSHLLEARMWQPVQGKHARARAQTNCAVWKYSRTMTHIL